MRYKLIFLILALMMAVPFTGTALASQEQLLHQQFGLGYYSTWRGSSTWDNGAPGSSRTATFEYSFPQEKLNQYILTRVEVSTGYSFDPDVYDAAGGRSGLSYDEYARVFLTRTPDDLICQNVGQDLEAGMVVVKWSLTLNPTYPPINNREALNIKDPDNRQLVNFLPKEINDTVEGWLWFLPVHIKWYGIPKNPVVNLVASSIDSGAPDEAEPGEQYTGTVKFKYFGTVPVNDVPIGAYNGQYRATLKKNGQPITRDNFNPGDVKTYTFNWTAPPSGETELKGVIDTPPLPDTYQETTEADNTVTETVFVKEPPKPSTPGSLTFQAVNQDRSKSRPAGTAKWTDWVTATLKPPSPKPPKGTLTSWEVTSAKLTYPKKNSEFTFGTPYGPVGTKTVPMKPNGQKATVEFQEDWGMDGAKIYSLIEFKLMVEEPKYYDITANYTVKYEYRYRVKTDSGYKTRTGTGTESGTVLGKLLVNGSGVNSLSQ